MHCSGDSGASTCAAQFTSSLRLGRRRTREPPSWLHDAHPSWQRRAAGVAKTRSPVGKDTHSPFACTALLYHVQLLGAGTHLCCRVASAWGVITSHMEHLRLVAKGDGDVARVEPRPLQRDDLSGGAVRERWL